MALKKIGALLALDGEKEFKKAASEINSSLKTMKSEMKLVTSEYAGSANSMAALSSKSEVLNKQFSAQKQKVDLLSNALENAQKNQTKISGVVKDYREELEKAESELDKMRKTSDSTNEELADQEKVVKDLSSKLEMAETAYTNAGKKVNSWENELNNAKVTLNDFGAEIKQNDKLIVEASTAFDGTAKSIDEFGNKIDSAGNSSLKTGDIIKANLISTAIIDGFQKLGRAVKDVATEVTTVGIEFESAFAGVKKTVTATDEEIEILRGSIIDMSQEIPATTTEISAVAEAAGQLGIQTDNLLGFTRTMIDLGNSTNIVADEAASSLAKFANITGMSQKDFDRLGSTIVSLGNNFATTEADIVAMGTRLAAAGTQIGLSEADIMGLATALSSVGMEAEAGGSAFSKAMINIQLAVETGNDDLQKYAEIAGMSAKEFKRAWQEDAAGALSTFITGLGDTSALGASTIAVLDEMGITEIRLRDSLLRASSASDEFNRALEFGNTAWEENTALTKEATQRYETAESKTELLKNSVDALCISAYDRFRNSFVAGVDGATEGVKNLNNSVSNGKLGNSIENLGEKLGELAEDAIDFGEDALPVVIDGLSWIMDNSAEIASLITGIGSAMMVNKGVTLVTKAADAYKACKLATEGATVAQIAFNTAQSASPIGLVTSAVVALGTALITYNVITGETKTQLDDLAESMEANRDEAEKSVAQFKTTAEEMGKSYDTIGGNKKVLDDLTDQLIILSEKEVKSADDKERMKLIVDELNSSVDGLNLEINDETSALNMSADAIRNSIDAMVEYKKAEKALENATDAAVELESATYDLDTAQNNLKNTSAAVKAAQEREEVALKNLTAARENGITNTHDYEVSLENARLEVAKATEAEESAQNTVDTLSEKVASCSETYEKWMGIVGDTTKIEEGSSKARTTLATNLAGAKTDAEEQMKLLVEESERILSEGGKESGKGMATGIGKGIEDNEEEAYGKVRLLCKGSVELTKRLLGINSPSKVFANLAASIPEGMAVGILENEEEALDAVKLVSKDMENAFEPNLASSAIRSGSAMYGYQGSGSKVDNSTKTVQVYFQPQSMTETDLDRCFNYVNRKFGQAGGR